MGDEVLSKIPLFAGLSADERADLGGLLKTRQYQPQAPVFWIGENGTEFYIVQDGAVSVSAPDEAGKEVSLAKLGPGNFFGEISLLDGGPRTATIRAAGDTTLLCLTREQFHDFLRKHPQAAIHMLTILGQRQRETNEKLRGVRNANQAIEENLSAWGRISSKIASLSASQSFVLLNVVFFGGWMLINMMLPPDKQFDAAPFGLAGFICSVEALFISLFVLVSANQQGDRDRIRADLDYQVNLKAQYEVMQLHRKLDRLQAMVDESRTVGDGRATGETSASKP
jgi:CRP/FNR family transcriptional regulator, cyclic AMP receptor protein